ncbi:hypothetical protein ACIQ9Q_25075 [Streptomyces sp. NPDC094438]|uniref:hypothetical protein n=1 Tax=Streptomyces sp. NPDC094438 TaxID=3366061 RepID=UPI003825C392
MIAASVVVAADDPVNGWQLAYPKTPEGLLALLDAGTLTPHTVLWLNEAVDACRLGHTSPLPAALLQAAARGYLTEEQCAADPDTWFTHRSSTRGKR